jgi:pimeloyl-ACP methyl ester carboxylesterase
MSKTVALVLLSAAACSLVPRGGDEPPPLKRIAVNGTVLAYVEEGQGVPVVFVHPTGGDWRSFDSLRPAVSDGYRYVAYSRRHHFPNPQAGDGADYAEASHVADLVALVRALSAAPVHVVGSASGAAIALRAALEHPELFRSAVLDEPTAPSLIAHFPEAKPMVEDAAARLEERRAAARAGDGRRAAELLHAWLSGEEPGALAQLPDDRQRLWSDNLRAVIASALAPVPPPLSCADVARLRVPVLVVRGERATPFFRLVCDTLAGCLPPGTGREVVARAGHDSYLDEPRAFQRIVLGFIEKH